MSKWEYTYTVEGVGTTTVELDGLQYQTEADLQAYATTQGHTIDGGLTPPNSSIRLVRKDVPDDFLSVNSSGLQISGGNAQAASGNNINSVLELPQTTGSALTVGQGMGIGANDSNALQAEELTGTDGDLPAFWANGAHPHADTGEYVFRGKVNDVIELLRNATDYYLRPVTAGTHNVYWDILNERFTNENIGWPKCGEFDHSGMSYRLDVDTTISWSANIVIDTDAEVNAIRNKTNVAPTSGGTLRHITLADPDGAGSHNDLLLTGDESAWVIPGGSSYGATFAVEGSAELLDPDGDAYVGALIIAPNAADKSVLLKVIDDSGTQKWQVTHLDANVVETDINVDYHIMKNSLDKTPVIKESSDSTFHQVGIDDDGVLATDEVGSSNRNRYMVENNRIVQTVAGLDSACTSDTQVVIQPGAIMSDDNTTIIELTAAATFDISSGAGVNGLDTGSETANTWYYVWLFYNPSTGATQLRGSTSNSSPTAPTGFTKKAIVSAVYNNSGGNFNQFQAFGYGPDKEYVYDNEFLTESNITVSTRGAVGTTNRVVNLGHGYGTCQITIESAGGGGSVEFFHGDNTNKFAFYNSDARAMSLSNVRLNTSGQFHISSTGGNVSGVYIKILSFVMKLK